MHKRFETFNKDKPLSKQIKPFNFTLVGFCTDKDIKPLSAFTKESQSVVHKPFIDYKSGKVRQGIQHWKSFVDTLFDYLDHPESKFENGTESGIMQRRQMNGGEIRFIGKEANNIEEQTLEVTRPNEYTQDKLLRAKILKMSYKEAREKGVPKQTFFNIKQRLRNNLADFNLRTKSTKKLLFV